MTYLYECTWQALNVTDQSGSEEAVVFAFFGSGQSYKAVQWFAGDRYVVCCYYN